MKALTQPVTAPTKGALTLAESGDSHGPVKDRGPAKNIQLAAERRTEKMSRVETARLIERLYALADGQSLSEAVKTSHISWVLRYIRFHHTVHPASLNQSAVENYLSYLAKELNYDSATQESAKLALEFLYQQFLNVTLEDLHFLRLKQRRGFFSRFSENDCHGVINHLQGTTQLMAKLALLAHLKLQEVVNLRLGDVDLKKAQIIVRNKSGAKKFIANIPLEIMLELRIQTLKVRHLVQQEKESVLGQDYSELTILAKQLEPEWQYLFPYHFANNRDKKSLLNQVPLKLLKHDIQVAIKSYQRFLPNSNVSNLSIRFPHNLKQSRFEASNKCSSDQTRLARRHNSHRQSSFNFNDNLGAA